MLLELQKLSKMYLIWPNKFLISQFSLNTTFDSNQILETVRSKFYLRAPLHLHDEVLRP
jgi:hypothetical protein